MLCENFGDTILSNVFYHDFGWTRQNFQQGTLLSGNFKLCFVAHIIIQKHCLRSHHKHSILMISESNSIKTVPNYPSANNIEF